MTLKTLFAQLCVRAWRKYLIMENKFPVETCKDLGVVGIDVAGSASGADEKYEESVVQVFQVGVELFRMNMI